MKDGVNAPASGWGLDNAVAAWGNYFSKQFIPSCTLTSILSNSEQAAYRTRRLWNPEHRVRWFDIVRVVQFANFTIQ